MAKLTERLKRIVGKINAIEKELNGQFIERESTIRDMIRALLLGEHMLMLGRWGTAKSALARELVSRVTRDDETPIKYFECVLNRTSDPSTLAGPYALSALKEDRFCRTGGGITDAQVAFLDEIFKTNGPMTDFLLPILNERVWHNDGKTLPIPLRTVIMASNEGPEDDMMAFYDRILFRHEIVPIQSYDNKMTMWKNFLQRQAKPAKAVPTCLTLSDLDLITRIIPRVKIDDQVLEDLGRVLVALEESNITPSDRRVNRALRLLQVEALLKGRSAAQSNDISCLSHVLGQDVTDLPTVIRAINQVINVILIKLDEIKDTLKEIQDEIGELDKNKDDLSHADLVNQATNVIGSLNILKNKTTSTAKEAASSEHKQTTAAIVKEIDSSITHISTEFLDINEDIAAMFQPSQGLMADEDE